MNYTPVPGTLNPVLYTPLARTVYTVSPWYIAATFVVVFVAVFVFWRFVVWPAIKKRRKTYPPTFCEEDPIPRR